MSCPPIPFTAAEMRREAFLWRLAAAFQTLMDDARNPCALKGGTALRFQAELSRPSTDLDFEGDQPISVRKTLVKAVAAAAPEGRYRIGRDFLWRGTVGMTLHDSEAGDVRSAVDYRKTGSRPGMPAKVPLGTLRTGTRHQHLHTERAGQPEAAHDRGRATPAVGARHLRRRLDRVRAPRPAAAGRRGKAPAVDRKRDAEKARAAAEPTAARGADRTGQRE